MTPFEHRLDIVGWSRQANYKMFLALVTLVYYGAARLGLLVAFESTNASPVWPPTGIAFAAVLLFGIRIWPAIALGAYLARSSWHHDGSGVPDYCDGQYPRGHCRGYHTPPVC